MKTKHELNIIYTDAPWPEDAKSWPQNRTLNDYLSLLLAPWPFGALSSEPKLPDVMVLLSLAWQANRPFAMSPNAFFAEFNPENKPIVVDIGMGDGNALLDIKKRMNVKTVGFSLHTVKEQNLPGIDLLCYSSVPTGKSAQKIFEQLRGKVALVCETYGAATYAKGTSNPIQALIFSGLLLAPGGVAKIISSSILEEDDDQSPLGFAPARERLVAFFKQKLNLDLIVSRSYIQSRVMPGRYCTDYHIEIKRNKDAAVSLLPLNILFHLAEVDIGTCAMVEKTSKTAIFDAFSIQGRTYTLIGEKPQLKSTVLSDHITQRDLSTMHQQHVFDFTFDSSAAMHEFLTRFAEYYQNNKPTSDWTIKHDAQNNKVTAWYIHPRQNLAAAVADLERIQTGLWKSPAATGFFQKNQANAGSVRDAYSFANASWF